jgi:hypothetical protein
MYYSAHAADGTPVAFAGVALLGNCGVLFSQLSDPGQLAASWARYQLHTFAALDLGRNGIAHLIAGSALRETAGNQYFQHLLGYRIRNLRLTLEE